MHPILSPMHLSRQEFRETTWAGGRRNSEGSRGKKSERGEKTRKGKIGAKRHARQEEEEAVKGATGRAGRVQQRQRGEGGGKGSRRVSNVARSLRLYVLCLSNWIAFHAVASNGPITVADGRPTYMAPEISLLQVGLEKLIRFPLR